MKKALAIILALVAVSAFAQTPTLAGSATLTWGYNLNTDAHGFVNSFTSSITLPLVAKATATAGEEAITGQITLKDYAISLKDSAGTDTITINSGSVTAKILFPNDLYMTIYSAPDFSVNNAQSFAPWVADEFDDDRGVVSYSDFGGTGGFAFGLDGDLSFALKVASVGDYNSAPTAAVPASTTYALVFVEDFTAVTAVTGVDYSDDDGATWAATPTANGTWLRRTTVAAVPAGTQPENDYGMGIDLGYSLGDLGSVNANFVYGAFSDADIALGLALALTPIEGLTFDLGVDSTIIADVTGFDLSAVLGYELADLLSFSAGAYFGKADLELDPATLDVQARVGILAVENLSADFGVDAWGLIDNPANDPMLLMIGGALAYTYMLDDVNYVKPYFEGGYELNDEVMAVKVGASFMLFPKTVFTVDFTAGELATDNVTGGVNAFDADKGLFTFATKITC